MSTALWVAGAWLLIGLLVSLLVGRAIHLREVHERPSGPRVRVVEARTVRPWVQR